MLDADGKLVQRVSDSMDAFTAEETKNSRKRGKKKMTKKEKVRMCVL
jgi:hypothetical protein